ncbi:ABC transporter ATP-binding protein [Candidatus Neptunochlamydia vexilliferae]|uniref:Oligopeptide transport ATP-binding protein YkfD n=1 Tax=Candidatus Neptunichlamydia vexilliferae TaxID=1651774 RepID=A0ABS0AYR7_9BACT|nr:oligopeptide/dipeptide ABC transporter ATP-binding protein [Candidatus Neptunochlamydia vexilliferae]MBF5059109.1 putative oligopeptide transport ATP-binding protein YkfD [Candidatus Neptunochlamydia vexilliferae]
MTLLEVKNLKKHFPYKGKVLRAVDGVSFAIEERETLGLVGESGCGKTALARALMRLYEPTSGDILFQGESILNYRGKAIKTLRHNMQYIFQDPFASLNPRMTAGEIIAEPLNIHNVLNPRDREQRVQELLRIVGLRPEYISRFPHEFSGGQRQRIGIARSLALNPRLIVCDEPIAALDVSIQAQIVNLLKHLQEEMGLTYLFISHDLAMVKYLSTRVAVMYLGHLMELAPSIELYERPLHPYTQGLLSAIPIPDPIIEKKRSRILLTGDVPSPVNPPKGCVFCTRCPLAKKECHEKRPPLREVAPGHKVACHLV